MPDHPHALDKKDMATKLIELLPDRRDTAAFIWFIVLAVCGTILMTGFVSAVVPARVAAIGGEHARIDPHDPCKILVDKGYQVDPDQALVGRHVDKCPNGVLLAPSCAQRQ